ncbi:universal stress protein [Planosporangium mesophilum]|uniref:Universal stress protein n=1 Tax=Planosporangium mesophilum TaxID=689768 RepID=A0A8J3TP46_9ACTN|nr:universal stress protein [Planosporangium mesophilum]NJC85700.1 universal stress protein [Planosporangium mesophilum]GII24840.1 universal stress protein [Planosporangium mesophilum]
MTTQGHPSGGDTSSAQVLPVVAGVDGSAPSLEALRWAALEAQRRHVELEVVLAYHWRIPGAALAVSPELAEQVTDFATAVVDAAVAEARTTAPHARVHGRAVEGEPAPVLLEAVDGAGLVVVGSRGAGGFASLLTGSVSVRVATQAPCPVVIVRGRADDDIGPVVVGVDGSAPADAAAGLAFEEASRRGCALVAVRAFHVPLPPYTMGPPPLLPDPAEIGAGLRSELVGQLAKWRDKYSDVPVEYAVSQGSAAAALVDQSRRASLVVVGNRGHGAARGTLFGSVGLQLLHHADCPVLITRTRT